MTLTDQDLSDLLAEAITAAERAGDYIGSAVGDHGETRSKDAGNTPASQVVTEIDLGAQRLILDLLGDTIARYGLGLLTEESEDDSSRLGSDYFWCIDPLDGTLPFTEGSPGYSVSIALVTRVGDPLIGVVHDPDSGNTFHAQRGRGAFKNGTPIPAPAAAVPGAPLTWLMDRSMKALADFAEIASAMDSLAAATGHSGVQRIDHAGSALNGAWVTQHAPAVYFKFPKASEGGGSFWDFAATACLLEAWHAPPTDIFGGRLDLNRAGSTFMNERGVLYASGSALGQAVQDLFRRRQAAAVGDAP